MYKKVAVQIKDQTFNGKDHISVIRYSTGFKRACDTSRIHGGSFDFLFKDFMTGPALVFNKVRLDLLSYDTNSGESTKTTYDRVMNHLLGQ